MTTLVVPWRLVLWAQAMALCLCVLLVGCGFDSARAAKVSITSVQLPNGTAGQNYSFTLAIAGGSPPYRCAVTGGALPPGITLTPDCTLTGTPSAAGTFSFTVHVTSGPFSISASQDFLLVITGNPVPSLASSNALSPSSVIVGGPAFTLTVTGSNFVSGSVVQWNGSSRPTTFVSSTQLTALISSADIAISGTASVAVVNPAPGGGTSGAATFAIYAGVIQRVSVASDGAQGDGLSPAAAISADGRYVVFESRASNLVADDTNGASDIFVRDTCVGATSSCTPSTVRVSLASDGTQADYDSFNSAISTNARYVAFASDASNLVPGDTNGAADIFVRDTCTGATSCTPSTIRVSLASDGTESNGDSGDPAISADGRFVTFNSVGGNLVPGDTNGAGDVFVRDTCIGATGCTSSTTRVSVASDGTQSDNYSYWPAISANGRYVAFVSRASNIGNGGIMGIDGIYVRDTCAGAAGCTPSTTSIDLGGEVAISADGRFVAFQSDYNLVAGDTNGAGDIFVHDTCIGASGCTPSTVRVSVASDGTQPNGASAEPTISANGRFVAFGSLASNLVPGDSNGVIDIFVRDTCVGATGCTPSTTRVSIASNGTPGNKGSVYPAVSAVGRYVAFVSDASNLVADDTNGFFDIFLARF